MIRLAATLALALVSSTTSDSASPPALANITRATDQPLSITINGEQHFLPLLPPRPLGHALGAADALVERWCNAQQLDLKGAEDCPVVKEAYQSWMRSVRAPASSSPADDARFYAADLTQALNRAVRESGAPLEGNSMYGHMTDFVPTGARELRANLFALAYNARNILEVGFNAGHSNAIFLLANPRAAIVNIDLCVHAYTRSAFDVIVATGANVQLVCEDSLSALPRLSLGDAPSFDLVHVDGGHGKHACFHDIVNAKRLASPETILVVDDVWKPHIKEVVDVMQSSSFLREVDYASLGLHRGGDDRGEGGKEESGDDQDSRKPSHRVFRYVFDLEAPHMWFAGERQGTIWHWHLTGRWQARGPYPKFAMIGEYESEDGAREAVAAYHAAHPEEWQWSN